jgi:hypothetical protein
MPATKKFIHDKTVLVLLSVNFFVAFISSVLILLRLGNGQGNNYIVQYRPSLGIGAFTRGSAADLLEFILFAALVLVVHTLLSLKTYHIKRELSLAILGMAVLLLVVSTIVSNALLVLR